MARFFTAVLSIALVAFASSAFAEEKGKETKFVGTVVCGKCELKEAKTCAVAFVTKDKDGKKVTYWFDTEASKKYHDDVCTETKEGTVVGSVAKMGDKMVLTVKSLEYKK